MVRQAVESILFEDMSVGLAQAVSLAKWQDVAAGWQETEPVKDLYS